MEEVAAHGGEGLGLVGVSEGCGEEVEGLTASIIPRPGVNMRPFTMLKALVSGWPLLFPSPFCRAITRWRFAHSPSICASPVFHSRESTDSDRSIHGKAIIVQQR